MIRLSKREARRLALISQGLHRVSPFGRGKGAMLRCIQQLGYVQIDTISVVSRAHHHTFWTRVPGYRESRLDSLVEERKILEYWFHAASYLPMRDYRYCLPYMRAVAEGQKHWRRRDEKTMRDVLARIRAEGPLMSRDFAPPKDWKRGEWWHWTPAKEALEQLFIEGELMASGRRGFHKVYDLPERVLPPEVDTRMPSDEEFQRYLILTAIRAHGLAAEAEMTYLRKGVKAGVRERLRQMLADREIVQVEVAGVPDSYYSTEAALAVLRSGKVARNVRLLSPFDNAVAQRKRVARLFDFDYQIECFVPAHKRRFGYYCLPILNGADFVGRLDPKADRRNKVLVIRNLVLEREVADLEDFTHKLGRKLERMARFNGCDEVVFRSQGGAGRSSISPSLLRAARIAEG